MSLHIRPARPDEAEVLPPIERSAGERFRSIGLDELADGDDLPPEFHRPLAEQGSTWVAERDGRLIGFIACEAFDDALHIWEFSVRQEAQGQGVGRALLTAAVEGARARGLPAVTLTTFRDVAWNGPFYARCGFAILTDGELNERLAKARANEAAHGLDVQPRCAMRLSL